MRVAVVHLAEAAATPREVHLSNQHPVVVGRDSHYLREMSRSACALDESREVDRRAGNGHAATPVLAAVEQVRLVAVQLVDPPVAVTEGATRRRILAWINRIDRSVATRRDRPQPNVWRPEIRAMAGLTPSVR